MTVITKIKKNGIFSVRVRSNTGEYILIILFLRRPPMASSKNSQKINTAGKFKAWKRFNISVDTKTADPRIIRPKRNASLQVRP